MKCEVFEQRMNELLDDRKAPEADRSLRAHADSCDLCSQVLVAQERLWDGLDMFDLPDLPTGFSENVVASIHPQRSNRGRGLIIAAWVAAVAAVLLVVLIPLASGPRDSNPSDNGAPVVENERQAPAIETALDQQDEPVDTGIARGFDEFELDENIMNLIPETTDFMKSVGTDNLASVRPISSTFSSAFTLIRRTLPGGKSSDAKSSDSSSTQTPPQKHVA